MTRFQGTQRYLAAYGPDFFLRVGIGLLLSSAVLVAAAFWSLWGLIPIALAIFLIVLYLSVGWLWAAYLRFDAAPLPPDRQIQQLGRILADEKILFVDLGERLLALELVRYLSTGTLTVVDIYNPQIFKSEIIDRWRQGMPPALRDPRLEWAAGTFDLFPVRDDSQDGVILVDILGELIQDGDRLLLLRELFRSLKPGGRIILVETPRTRTNWLLRGPAAARLRSVAYWEKLLREAGFSRVKSQLVNEVVGYFRAEKLEPLRGIQLPLLQD